MAKTMVMIWRVCVAIAFVSARKTIVASVESYLFMAPYPVCDFRCALQGIISTSVEEKIVDCPESVGAYAGSSGWDDKPGESIVPGRYLTKGDLAFLTRAVKVNRAIYYWLANVWGKGLK